MSASASSSSSSSETIRTTSDPSELRRTVGGQIAHNSTTARSADVAKSYIRPPASALTRSGAESLPQKKIPTQFVKKLFTLVNSTSDEIVEWSSDGLQFIIKDIDRFSNEVLTKYFKSSRMPSFYRQLQFYNFARDFVKNKKGSDTKSIKVSHPYFIRGRADLLGYIQRITADKGLKKEVQTLRAKVRQLEGNCAHLHRTCHMLSEKLDKVWGIVEVMAQRAAPGTAGVLKRDVFRDFSNKSKKRKVTFSRSNTDNSLFGGVLSPKHTSSDRFDDDDDDDDGVFGSVDEPVLSFDGDDNVGSTKTRGADKGGFELRITPQATMSQGLRRTYASEGDASARPTTDTVTHTLSSMSLADDDVNDDGVSRTMSSAAMEDYSELVRLLSFDGDRKPIF